MKQFAYLSVTKNRPCHICHHTSICFYTKNKSLSICARQRVNFDFEIRNSRWKVFSHIKDWKANPPKQVIKLLQQKPPLLSRANIAIRDFAYHLLLKYASISKYPQAIEFLQSRGISRPENYGAMPTLRETRRQIALQILEELRRHFPKFQDIWEITRIPGFWIKDNQPEFWYKSNFSETSILIPFRTPDGKIKGLQTRPLNPQSAQNGKRYHWLSVPKLISAKANVTLHFADWQSVSTATEAYIAFEEKKRRPLLITEGALKADIVQEFTENNRVFSRPISVIGNSGIGSCLEEIVQYSRNRKVRLAFDQDFRNNRQAHQSILKLIGCFKKALIPPKDLKIVAWDKEFKGIDEALQKQTEIKTLSVKEWIAEINQGN